MTDITRVYCSDCRRYQRPIITAFQTDPNIKAIMCFECKKLLISYFEGEEEGAK